MVAGHVDDRHPGQALGEPAEGAGPGRVYVAGDDGRVEPARRRVRGWVPGVLRLFLVQVGEDPEALRAAGHLSLIHI